MLYTAELAAKLAKAIDGIEIDTKASGKEREFDVVASTEDVDRTGEIILVDGWDTAAREKNPVVLANHEYEVESIIGMGTKFYTSNGVKRLKGVFSQTNPLAILVKDMYREGMINAVSVGFIARQRNQDNFKIIERAELLEVSFVAIPCNPYALSTEARKLFDEGVAKGLIIKADGGEEPTEPTPGERDVPVITPNDIPEPTVTPCNGCGCTDCTEQKNMMKEMKSMLENIVKNMVDDNTMQDGGQTLKEQKEIVQSIDKAINEACRGFKKLQNL